MKHAHDDQSLDQSIDNQMMTSFIPFVLLQHHQDLREFSPLLTTLRLDPFELHVACKIPEEIIENKTIGSPSK